MLLSRTKQHTLGKQSSLGFIAIDDTAPMYICPRSNEWVTKR